MFVIYQITNTITGHSYIGFTTNLEKRWRDHRTAALRGGQTHFQNAIRKYSVEAFKVEILEEGWCSKIGLKYREPFWIETLKPRYNMTSGGQGRTGADWTPEARKKLSLLAKGNKHCLGRKLSEETRKKISISKKGNNYCVGRKVSQETKKRISESNKGNKNCLGRKLSEETKRKMAESCKTSTKRQELNKLMSAKFKGIRRGYHPVIVCPHCGLAGGEGGHSGMYRFHFDNCKMKGMGVLSI